jgi:hypothetical protein
LLLSRPTTARASIVCRPTITATTATTTSLNFTHVIKHVFDETRGVVLKASG